ncbi:sensor histidine kinase [Actinoplanes sp. CA-142083]|uniref:sensor histidine kinase n=1 Tax=Actinoplanes sp. CA-142083 TaxID=3239903 RepID=UPI003D918E26
MQGKPRRQGLPWVVWVELIWGAAAFSALRAHSGLPGMPTGLPGPSAWGWALVTVAVVSALAAGALARRRPLAGVCVLVVSAVAIVTVVGQRGLASSLESSLTLFLFAADLVLGYVVVTQPPWAWLAAAVPVLAALPVAGYLSGAPTHWTVGVAYAVLPALVAGLVGFSIRQARDYARRLSEQTAAQAVIAERLRISRELHDHVAHSVGVIALQAGAAARVMDTQPDRAREAMRAVEATSRDTLSGLRRMVGGLRVSGDGPAESPPLHPAPSLADVDDLVVTTGAAGIEVDLCWAGDRRPLPADVELSAYRIIQESLTNVLRHADVAACRVLVEFHPAELAIEVTDDGRGGGSGPPGYGLAGLRERVALLHGTMTAGPRPAGGFQVAARLPVEMRVAAA